MLVTTIYSLGYLLVEKFIPSSNYSLIGISVILFLLAWLVFFIAIKKFIGFTSGNGFIKA